MLLYMLLLIINNKFLGDIIWFTSSSSTVFIKMLQTGLQNIKLS